MLKSRYYIFILCFVGLFFTSKASHNRAGEITYKWVGPGPYTYQIKVVTYTNLLVISGLTHLNVISPARLCDALDVKNNPTKHRMNI